MRLDSNPRSMVMIMTAVGVCAIGIILTIAFFYDSSLLGIGITMAVVGGAGSILGCIHLGAQDMSRDGKSVSDTSVAPNRIPDLPLSRRPRGDEDDDDVLEYPECSVSPPRDVETVRPNAVVPTQGANFVLSPFDQRSFPVPVVPSSAAKPSDSPYRVVIDSAAYSPGDRGVSTAGVHWRPPAARAGQPQLAGSPSPHRSHTHHADPAQYTLPPRIVSSPTSRPLPVGTVYSPAAGMAPLPFRQRPLLDAYGEDDALPPY